MAKIQPFAAYRYSAQAGAPPSHLVTQPYDKISPAMRERYLSLSEYNLVRVILNRDYAEAAANFEKWIASGVLKQDAEPALYAYFQEFTDPERGERLVRKGFIGLGQLEEYDARIVHRHEQTLSGPKKDRLELLRHTHAHFGQLFMLYPDEAGAIDAILDQAASGEPLVEVTDEYAAVHRMWRIADTAAIGRIQGEMAAKKLIIADGHHRYETALQFSKESPLEGAKRVMMTFVNMYSPGVRILATHRLVAGLTAFDGGELLEKLELLGKTSQVEEGELRRRMAENDPGRILIGVALGRGNLHVLEAPRTPGDLDVRFLHERILDQTLGISEEAVREEKYLRYLRGIDAALEEVRGGRAQAAFLLQPTRIEEVAAVSFSGGVMPQKSTDFYPKLLSGLTVYRVEG